jgi:hypothetical protein
MATLLIDNQLLYALKFTPSVAKSGEFMSIYEYINLFPYLNVDPDPVNTEWQLLSELEKFRNPEEKKISPTKFWQKVSRCKNELKEPMFSNLMEIVKIVLSLPHSSTTAERIFSQLSLIKSKTRNKLNITTC